MLMLTDVKAYFFKKVIRKPKPMKIMTCTSWKTTNNTANTRVQIKDATLKSYLFETIAGNYYQLFYDFPQTSVRKVRKIRLSKTVRKKKNSRVSVFIVSSSEQACESAMSKQEDPNGAKELSVLALAAIATS